MENNMESSHLVNVEPVLVNRLTSAVQKLCEAEKQMKTLKTEFKEIKNEVVALAGIIIKSSTDSCLALSPGGAPSGFVIEELSVAPDNTLLINIAEPVSTRQNSKNGILETLADAPAAVPPASQVITEMAHKRLSFENNPEEICLKKQKVESDSSIVASDENSVQKSDDSDYVEVFTSGECEDNGRPWGRAGLGIYFGPGNPLNCSLPIEGTRTTLNAASINACIQALRIGLENGIKKMKIYTDSEFTHNCITKWMDVWKENDWKTFKGGKVKFRTELERLDKLTIHFEALKWILETEDRRIREAGNLAETGVMKYVRADYF